MTVAVVAEAVADRLPASGRVGVSMSGGLDSPTLAAFAVASAGDRGRVVAECVHYERLMPDDEARFSTLAYAWDPDNPLNGRAPRFHDLSHHREAAAVV